MTRSIWKGPYINTKLLFKIKQQSKLKNKKIINIWSRSSTIIPEFLNHIFMIHTGNKFIKLVITKEMINHKFGEFASTRKLSKKKKFKKINKK